MPVSMRNTRASVGGMTAGALTVYVLATNGALLGTIFAVVQGYGLAGGLLTFITPFKPGQALGMALLACVAGSLGHLVMKALKRDRGITSWGMQGMSVTPQPEASASFQ